VVVADRLREFAAELDGGPGRWSDRTRTSRLRSRSCGRRRSGVSRQSPGRPLTAGLTGLAGAVPRTNTVSSRGGCAPDDASGGGDWNKTVLIIAPVGAACRTPDTPPFRAPCAAVPLSMASGGADGLRAMPAGSPACRHPSIAPRQSVQ
jgi:hypothetical protein